MVDDEHTKVEEEEIEDGDIDDSPQGEAKRVIKRMREAMKDLGEGHDLAKARTHLIETVNIYKDGKFFEIPNREAVFNVILDVAREKYQRGVLLEKIKVARGDIKSLHKSGMDVEDMIDVFKDISEYVKDKDYETARAKFLTLEFQITAAKKSLGEDIGSNPLADPKVKKVVITDEGLETEDGMEMLPVLEVIEDDEEEAIFEADEDDKEAVIESKEDDDEAVLESTEDDDEAVLEWEDDDESADSEGSTDSDDTQDSGPGDEEEEEAPPPPPPEPEGDEEEEEEEDDSEGGVDWDE